VGRRLILDTNVLIAYERGTIERGGFDDDEIAVAAVSIAEYRVGIELADTAQRAADRARALAAIASAIDILDYTETTAAHHARLIAHVRRIGKPRGAHAPDHRGACPRDRPGGRQSRRGGALRRPTRCRRPSRLTTSPDVTSCDRGG
jgi:tRNA(fMet)-specific endonuclease VapC